MDAALITGMLKIGFDVTKQPTKDVEIKKDSNFKDVLSKIGKTDEGKQRDVKKTDNEKKSTDVKEEDVKNEKVEKEDVKTKDTKEKKEVQDEEVQGEEVQDEDGKNEETVKNEDKINVLIENILSRINENKDIEKTDVENIGKIEAVIGEISNELNVELSDEEMLKIQEELTKRMNEEVSEVGPQKVETELSKYDEMREKLEALESKIGASGKNREDVKENNEDVTSGLTEKSGSGFVPDFDEKSFEGNKESGKESKFKITDFRRNKIENNLEQPEFNVKDVDLKIADVDVKSVKDVFMRVDELQEKYDIIKQVSEQVDVSLFDDKSEMIVKLKPDHLGKVTVQISVENGIISAKFLAESQRVKEVLESNFQDLKDHLAKQGMAIENLSVSVGNDNSRGMFEQRNIRSFGRRNKADSAIEGLNFVEGTDYVSEQRTASYWPDSTVSFSA